MTAALPPLEGAIFDLDGTLLDSMGVWAQIDRDWLGRRGIPLPPDYTKAVAPLGFRAAAEYSIARFHLNERPEDVIAEWNAMSIDAYTHTVDLKPGAKEFLLALSRRGVRLAVATSSHPELFTPALARHGLLPLFDNITTVGEAARGKGFPDVYLLAAEKMNVSPACCAVFEDILAGVQGAKAGGFFTVAVADKTAAHHEAELRRAADLYIPDFRVFL